MMRLVVFSFIFLFIALVKSDTAATTSPSRVGKATNVTLLPVDDLSTTQPPGPSPLPSPKATVNTYVLTNATFNCTLLSFSTEFQVKIGNESLNYVFGPDTVLDTAQSSCNNDNTIVVLKSPDSNTLGLNFKSANGSYSLTSLNLTVLGQNNTKHEIFQNETLFKVLDSRSYLCKHGQKVDIGPNSWNETASITFGNIKLDVFRTNSTSNEYRTPQECSEDFEDDDVVPFIVGCGLIALVLIVLIAYLIGRKRSRRLHYQSV